jgi:hypothetical protein
LKIFNEIHKNISTKIKPTETSAKMNYASAFDPNFFLLLSERRDTSLDHMQDATLEVESNILAADKLRSKDDRERRKGRSKTPTSSSSTMPRQMDEVTKLLKLLSAKVERLELEGKKSYRNPPNSYNRGIFKRQTNAPQSIQRDQRNRDIDDQKIQTPLQNNLVTDEDEEEEDIYLAIHCLGDTSWSPHLT